MTAFSSQGYIMSKIVKPDLTYRWAHVAIVGDGTNIKEYVDGVLAITTAHPNWSAGNNLLNIGQDSEDTFVGYMNDLRISDIAVYTANFTPPTSPF